MSGEIVRLYLVSGRVQGVCFRAATRERARELGVDGHARNLADGSVEVLAAGSALALSALESFLWRGPPHARVDQVVVAEGSERPAPGFVIG
jgi:acylphosphatase